jgi:hypothetical protein
VRKRYYKYYERAKDFSRLRELIQEDEINLTILKGIALIPAITNVVVDIIRVIKEPSANNGLKAILSTSHLYSIHKGWNYYAMIPCAINVGIHISNAKYSDAVKDLLMTTVYMAVPAFAVYMGVPYIGPVVAGGVALLTLVNAVNNGVSLYNEWSTDAFALKAAVMRIDLMQPISKWSLPIISGIAFDVVMSGIQTISDIRGKLMLAAAESSIKATFMNESSLQVNYVNIPSRDQDYKCIETEVNNELAYHCYNHEEASLELVAAGGDACNIIESL